MLRQVESSQTSALSGRTWRLAEIRQASGVVLSTNGQAPFTLTFGADGRYNGQADCNQYGGAFESGAGGTLSLSAGLSTLAACPDPSASGAFFGILSSAERYTIDGGRLTIRAQDGGALVFE